jgi:hypothetical protein
MARTTTKRKSNTNNTNDADNILEELEKNATTVEIEDDEGVSDDLLKEAESARLALEESEKRAAPDIREKWLAYGTALAKIRARIPSRALFGQYLEEHNLTMIGGVETEKGVRNAAMVWATYSDSEREVIASMYPAVHNPRTLKSRYEEMLTELLADFTELALGNELGIEVDRLSSDEDERQEQAEERYSAYDKVMTERMNSAKGPDRERYERLGKFFRAMPVTSFAEKADKFDYDKYIERQNKAQPIPFKELPVVDAAEKVLKIIDTHPNAYDILEYLAGTYESRVADLEATDMDADEVEEDEEDLPI